MPSRVYAPIERGERYGLWLVIDICERDRDQWRAQMIWCRCDCGVERLVRAVSLQRGISNGCGCYCRELLARLSRRRVELEKALGIVRPRHRGRWCKASLMEAAA